MDGKYADLICYWSHPVQGIGKTDYLTLESLTVYAAQQTLSSISNTFSPEVKPSVTVAIAKPCALVYASASEVQVTRTYDDFQLPPPSNPHKAVIALGSNIGDRFYNIEYALRLLENPQKFISDVELGLSPVALVVDTSFLYETAPMYVTDQPAFINGACLVMIFQFSTYTSSLNVSQGRNQSRTACIASAAKIHRVGRGASADDSKWPPGRRP